MPIKHAHPILSLQPVNPQHILPHNFRTVVFHNYGPYEHPTIGDIQTMSPVDLDVEFSNNATKRPNLKAPTAYRWHHRMACASLQILTATKTAVDGMMIQKDSMQQFSALLPCEACIAGKWRKRRTLITLPSHLSPVRR